MTECMVITTAGNIFEKYDMFDTVDVKTLNTDERDVLTQLMKLKNLTLEDVETISIQKLIISNKWLIDVFISSGEMLFHFSLLSGDDNKWTVSDYCCIW